MELGLFCKERQTMGSNTSKIYIRDGRAPIPKNESVSKVMSANKARSTKPEIILRRTLWAHGHPDITFPCKKLAIS